jgi:hypothetical protein
MSEKTNKNFFHPIEEGNKKEKSKIEQDYLVDPDTAPGVEIKVQNVEDFTPCHFWIRRGSIRQNQREIYLPNKEQIATDPVFQPVETWLSQYTQEAERWAFFNEPKVTFEEALARGWWTKHKAIAAWREWLERIGYPFIATDLITEKGCTVALTLWRAETTQRKRKERAAKKAVNRRGSKS